MASVSLEVFKKCRDVDSGTWLVGNIGIRCMVGLDDLRGLVQL